jgi:hypothetical protein
MSEEEIMDTTTPTIPFSVVAATGATTIVLASTLAYLIMGKLSKR